MDNQQQELDNLIITKERIDNVIKIVYDISTKYIILSLFLYVGIKINSIFFIAIACLAGSFLFMKLSTQIDIYFLKNHPLKYANKFFKFLKVLFICITIGITIYVTSGLTFVSLSPGLIKNNITIKSDTLNSSYKFFNNNELLLEINKGYIDSVSLKKLEALKKGIN